MRKFGIFDIDNQTLIGTVSIEDRDKRLKELQQEYVWAGLDRDGDICCSNEE